MNDVVVVGGGPAGAATALRLAWSGFRVALLERARYPRHKACAEYMSPGVVRELTRLGLAPQVEAVAGARLDGFTLFAGDRSFTGRFAGAPAGRAPRYGLGVSRAVLDHILVRAAAAAGVDVYEGARVTDLHWRDGRVAGAVVRGAVHDCVIPARLVVGADGVRSVVARRLGALEPRRGMDRIALVAHVGGIAGPAGRGEMHVGAGGYCGIAPLGGGVANVAMVLRDAGACMSGRAEPFFWEYLRTLPRLRDRLEHATVVRPVMAVSGMSQRARRMSDAGVLLAGDAGGFYDPFTGQGVHRALISAALVAEVAGEALVEGDVRAERLAEYDRRRRARFRGNHAVEWLVQQFISRPALFDRAVRRLASSSAMADTLVGVTGDIVPPLRVLNPSFLGPLALPSVRPLT